MDTTESITVFVACFEDTNQSMPAIIDIETQTSNAALNKNLIQQQAIEKSQHLGYHEPFIVFDNNNLNALIDIGDKARTQAGRTLFIVQGRVMQDTEDTAFTVEAYDHADAERQLIEVLIEDTDLENIEEYYEAVENDDMPLVIEMIAYANSCHH